MKKSLVLAMAMALGVTASAYAANPFSDVPAGHWAYDSVAELAAAGVVDGYADGTFGGDKLMTRYEMAQIVAKAMANGANVDKLAAEFADELDNLGVRVANLEKKADNVKITGQIRARYHSHDMEGKDDVADLRTRLFVNGQINDNWSYTGMIENVQTLTNDDDDKVSEGNSAEEDTKLKRAYLNGRLGGLDVVAGRYNEVTSTGNVLDIDADGVKVSYGKDVKVSASVFKAAGDEVTAEPSDRLYVVGVESQIGVFDVYANYFKASDAAHVFDTNDKGELIVDAKGDKEVYNVGLSFDVAKDLNLGYEYMWGDKEYNKEVSKDGYVVSLAYKGAGEEVGSYGLYANYFDQPVNAFLAPTTDATVFADGYKGWNVGADYTLAKNITLEVNYYDTESKDGKQDDQSIFSALFFNF